MSGSSTLEAAKKAQCSPASFDSSNLGPRARCKKNELPKSSFSGGPKGLTNILSQHIRLKGHIAAQYLGRKPHGTFFFQGSPLSSVLRQTRAHRMNKRQARSTFLGQTPGVFSFFSACDASERSFLASDLVPWHRRSLSGLCVMAQ